jgi:hypothetical protein
MSSAETPCEPSMVASAMHQLLWGAGHSRAGQMVSCHMVSV